MFPRFYHVNLDWRTDEFEAWSPEIMNELSLNTAQVSVIPSSASDLDAGWSAQHLFVASVSTNVMQAFFNAARKEHFAVTSLSLKSTGIEHRNSTGISEVIIVAQVEVSSDEESEIAERILKGTKAASLFKNINTKITIKPFIEISSFV